MAIERNIIAIGGGGFGRNPGEGIIEEYILKQTRKKFKIILTGGFAHLFKSSIKGIKSVDKNLTIKGILKVAIN